MNLPVEYKFYERARVAQDTGLGGFTHPDLDCSRSPIWFWCISKDNYNNHIFLQLPLSAIYWDLFKGGLIYKNIFCEFFISPISSNNNPPPPLFQIGR